LPVFRRPRYGRRRIGLPGKEGQVRRGQLIGGIILLAGAAVIFLFLDTDASVPGAITLMIVGLALVVGSRRKRSL
jgi:hypothetical protein